MKQLIYLCFFSLLFACANNDQATTNEADKAGVVLEMHPLPDVLKTDSIDMQFFPNAEDQKTYTRLGVNDSATVQLLVNNELRNPAATAADCLYDTKLFCFSKGEVVKTLYIAAQSDSCRYIAFVKSGGITVKASLSDSTATLIQQLRSKAK